LVQIHLPWHVLLVSGHFSAAAVALQGKLLSEDTGHMEAPADEARDAVDASRAHGVHGPEPVLALGAGGALESGLFVGWVMVKTRPNVVTSLPWCLKLAVTFNMAGFLKLTHWVIASGGNIIPSSCLSGWCFID